MQVISCTTPGLLAFTQRAQPLPERDRTLIKVRRVGVCGTDLHAFEGTQPYFSYPRVLGHEFSGIIEHTHGNPAFKAGDAVTCVPYFNCGKCIACNAGKPNCCMQVQVCGVHIDGAMADYISVPTAALVAGQGLSMDELALVEPFAIGAHGVQRAAIEQDEFVLVMGAGPIGLCTLQMAMQAGCRVIALDVNAQRLSYCSSHLKLPFVINGATQDAEAALLELTNGNMPTVVIDATGNREAILQGFKYLAHGGRYVLVGLQKGDIVFSHPDFHKREATLMSSRNATRADFDRVIRSRLNGELNLAGFITHRAAFEQVPHVFASWTKPETGVIKAIIELD